MKTRNLFLALSLACCSTFALADDWSFVDTNINRLEWTAPTVTRTNEGPFAQKSSFTYAELEGGKGGDWGDLYGFMDIENPFNRNDNTEDNRMDRRVSTKAVARFKLTEIGDLPLMLYASVYDTRDNGFYDQNRVLGFGTNLSFGKLWIHPFLGVAQELKSDVGAHFSGGMGGYVLGYNFDAFGQSFTLCQWQETEFARKTEYLSMAEGGNVVTAGKTGQNGAISVWWNVNKHVTTGVSYRYAENKLGDAGYVSALIYTLKYNF